MLSLVYTALHRERIANLITLTTPVDFHTPDNLLSKWVRQVDTASSRRAATSRGRC